MSALRSPIVVAPGEGNAIPRPDSGGAVTIKLSSGQTGGLVTLWESQRSAGDTRGPGIHAHPDFDEIYYVLTGEYEFSAATERIRATAGTLVLIPRGMFHTFGSIGAEDGRMLTLALPGGIEEYFAESAVNPDAPRRNAIGRKHGVMFDVSASPAES